ncbi:MAG: methylmalonyl-CoA epimerase [Candidatus Marinimicrobia bacterium]|jgi:methylmalonyl-CoA/ethylmalonyl-CoA epimerase|nr:methylmalonyl-CoA epimerase [Candidatus Neomarinimicrobiota bacterium]
MIKKISHIGIAVKSINEQMSYYRDDLGLKFAGIEIVEDQKVKVAFFEVGEARIELLEPTSEDSPVAKFIDKKGEGIHHLAYGVENISESIKKMEKAGGKMIDHKSRMGAGNHQIAFLHPKSTFRVLTELTEEH